MATVQSSYTEKHNKAYAGLIADTTTCDVDSFLVDDDAGIGFGLAVRRGAGGTTVSTEKKALAYDANNEDDDGSDFIGVSVLDKTLQPSQEDRYVRGDIASVLWRGDIWVVIEGNVTQTSIVSFNPRNGKFSARPKSSVDGAEQVELAGCRWLNAVNASAGANSIAILRVPAHVVASNA